MTAAREGGSGDGRHVTVVGAGMVGVCCAAYLQRRGVRVTLVDPLPPGSACSFGNAGVVAPGACLPMAMPGLWMKVPGFILDPLGPLAIRTRDLPRSIPWLAGWLRASAHGRVAEISAAMRALHKPAFDTLGPLLRDAGAEDLLVRNGQLYVSSSHVGVLGNPSAALLRAAGVRTRLLSAGEVHELEPCLAPGIKGGLLFEEHGHSLDPFAVVQRLAETVVRDGGEVVRDRVRDFETSDGRVVALVGEARRRPVDQVLIAAGAWADRLAARLGTRLRLIAERGYHVTAARTGPTPTRPISHMDHRIAITPMRGGLRFAGMVEIADVDAPAHPERFRRLRSLAQTLVPAADLDGATEWMGARPSLPDGLPLIDRSPNFANAFLAVGHSHYGFMGAAPTGRLVADLMTGTPPFIDPGPYALARF